MTATPSDSYTGIVRGAGFVVMGGPGVFRGSVGSRSVRRTYPLPPFFIATSTRSGANPFAMLP